MFKKLILTAFIFSGLLIVQNDTIAQDDPTESKTESTDKKSKDESTVNPSVTNEESSEKPAGIKMEDGILYGKDYDPGMTVVEYSTLMSNPSEYAGKTVIVKGKVSDVCQKAGCWIILSDGTNNTRVTTLHTFVVPKDIAGSQAVVIGKFIENELSEEMAKHYNDESVNKKDESEIKGSSKVFEIEADGIKVLNTVGNN
ncbi:MAG TPA: DUF4920 domain-containing protein [Ignavibacteria bacterium]|nr:hypothetical protein [Bacteroidota bacterium]HRI84146.1 DUF4920 domain-containing protein [Ignavibacteria bacterium]HRJ98818.1 DUF4920 domain-containing protein [Ignavibacteria bacterium]